MESADARVARTRYHILQAHGSNRSDGSTRIRMTPIALTHKYKRHQGDPENPDDNPSEDGCNANTSEMRSTVMKEIE
eukprot:6470534-Heterocapsa_arctica.AAC.1